MSVLIDGTRVTWGIVYALVLALVAWVVSQKTIAGFRMQVAGLAPAAAAYAGFSEKRNIWIALLVCGATAGLAGICEVAGPDRAAAAADFAGLRFCRDHRRLDRTTASDRSDVRCAFDGVALSRRRSRRRWG